MNHTLKQWLGDIRFWIGITFVHRLFSIMQPPLEMAHNWRQTTVCMVARNFYEVDPNIFFPRVDMAGSLSGITGMEFPLLNYLIYLVSLVFGYDHWYGRLINLVVSSAGIWAFYQVLKKIVSEQWAKVSTVILLFSVWYMFSRKIMPDTFSVSLVLIGISILTYRPKSILRTLVATALIGLGVAAKLPAAIALCLLWPWFVSVDWKRRLITGLVLAPWIGFAAWWYFQWVPHLTEHYGYEHFFMGRSVAETLQFLSQNFNDTLKVFYADALGYTGCFAVLAGAIAGRKQLKTFWPVVLIGGLLLIAFIAKSGNNFYRHEYYIIPFVPVMALIAGGIVTIQKRWVWTVLLIAVCTEGLTRKWDDQFVKKVPEMAAFDQAISSVVAADAKVVINSGEYPTPLYFAHRIGWIMSNDQLAKTEVQTALIAEDCAYALIMTKRFGEMIELPYPMVEKTDWYIIYKMQ